MVSLVLLYEEEWEVEWSTLIGRGPSRYYALIGEIYYAGPKVYAITTQVKVTFSVGCCYGMISSPCTEILY